MRTISAAMILACSLTYGQPAGPKPVFEVATIKPSTPSDGRGMRVGCTGGPGTPDPGRWACENLSLSNMITNAYNLKGYEFSKPAWLNEVRFDITAKIPEGTTKEQFLLMRQNLLEERFKLTFHREQKEMSGYELTVAKNGTKLKEAVEQPAPKDSGPPPSGPLKTDKDGDPILSGGMTMAMMNGRARWQCANCAIDRLAVTLGAQLSRPVMDATGLTGKYDMAIYWSTETGRAAPPPGPGGGDVPMASTPEGPTLFGALQDQLGLKLESKKAMIDILVVDKIEKAPTEN